jgi:hypothetical protein
MVTRASVRRDEGRRKRPEPRRESEGLRSPKWLMSDSREKPKHVKHTPVPETDTGGLVEDTKGRELTLSKELGKMAP